MTKDRIEYHMHRVEEIVKKEYSSDHSAFITCLGYNKSSNGCASFDFGGSSSILITLIVGFLVKFYATLRASGMDISPERFAELFSNAFVQASDPLGVPDPVHPES